MRNSIWGATGWPFLPIAEPRGMPRSGARLAGVSMSGGMDKGKLTSAPAGVATSERANLCLPVFTRCPRMGVRGEDGSRRSCKQARSLADISGGVVLVGGEHQCAQVSHVGWASQLIALERLFGRSG